MARHWSLGRLVPLTLSVNAASAGAAGDEFFHQRQKKCLAEMAKWHLRLKVERLADDVLIVFVKYNPEAQRSVEADATFFHLRNFDGKTIGGGLLTSSSFSKFESYQAAWSSL